MVLAEAGYELHLKHMASIEKSFNKPQLKRIDTSTSVNALKQHNSVQSWDSASPHNMLNESIEGTSIYKLQDPGRKRTTNIKVHISSMPAQESPHVNNWSPSKTQEMFFDVR